MVQAYAYLCRQRQHKMLKASVNLGKDCHIGTARCTISAE